MSNYSWCEGYDGEYEYSVTVHDNYIRWHLEFDIQWSDPPREDIQSFEDFLADGNPSGFSNRFNQEIEEEIKLKISKKDYFPLSRD